MPMLESSSVVETSVALDVPFVVSRAVMLDPGTSEKKKKHCAKIRFCESTFLFICVF